MVGAAGVDLVGERTQCPFEPTVGESNVLGVLRDGRRHRGIGSEN